MSDLPLQRLKAMKPTFFRTGIDLFGTTYVRQTVNCDNRKTMGKQKWHRTRSEKSTKNDNM